MKKLKKFLIPLLLCSVFCFIPKTYALTSFETEHFDASVYSTISPYNYLRSYTDVTKVQTGANEFLDFTQMFVDSNYSRTCDGQSFIYRIDYQLFGGHNQNKTDRDWVNFSKLITADRLSGVPNYVEVIGSIVTIPSWDKVNVSTFIKYTWATSDNCQTMDLNLTLDFNDTASDLYFYVPNVQSNYYTIYNAAYELSNEEQAKQLINEYYEKYSITNEKLNSIEQKIIDTNNKLDNIQDSIQNTNDKLDNVNSSLKDTQDYLKDDTAPSSDISVLGNVQGILPEGPIDSLLNIPFKVLSILNSSFGGVCVPISGKFVFDSTLTIPCFSELFYNNVPDGIMVFINVVPTAFILIAYLKNLYKRVDRALSLETSADDEWGGI